MTSPVAGSGNNSGVHAASSILRRVADANAEIKFLHAWEIQGESSVKVFHGQDRELAASRRAKIAKYVAYTKEVRRRIIMGKVRGKKKEEALNHITPEEETARKKIELR